MSGEGEIYREINLEFISDGYTTVWNILRWCSKHFYFPGAPFRGNIIYFFIKTPPFFDMLKNVIMKLPIYIMQR